jgi:hypothetical protein
MPAAIFFVRLDLEKKLFDGIKARAPTGANGFSIKTTNFYGLSSHISWR